MEPPGIAGSRIEKLETGYMQDSLEAIADALGTIRRLCCRGPPNESDVIPAISPKSASVSKSQ
jgi:hypothetical protein